MIWRAWKNSKGNRTGAGYGFKIDLADRLKYFKRRWKSVFVELPQPAGYVPIEINIDKPSFWASCGELVHQEIGQWILKGGAWPPGKPWRYEIEVMGERRFRVNRRLPH